MSGVGTMTRMMMYSEVGPGGGDRVQAPSVHRGQADVRLLFKVPGDNLARDCIMSCYGWLPRRHVMLPNNLSRNGIMYKPGASFYDEAEDKTLVCCSGNIYASLGRL